MTKFLDLLAQHALGPVARLIVGVTGPLFVGAGFDPAQTADLVEKMAQLLAGQTPTYLDRDDQDAAEGGADTIRALLAQAHLTGATASVGLILGAVAGRWRARAAA